MKQNDQIAPGTAINRRTAVGLLGAMSVAPIVASVASAAQESRPGSAAPFPPGGAAEPSLVCWDEAKGEYVLPPLPYGYSDLVIYDPGIMEFHHERHHAGYVRLANRALAELKTLRDNESRDNVLNHWLGELAFNVGGHINHTLFWHFMKPEAQGGGGLPKGELEERLVRDFGSLQKFAVQFRTAALNVQGSGWAWVSLEPMSRRLIIHQMGNQQHGMWNGLRPILGIDMWEHAYYLQFVNRRDEYFDTFMKLVNWDFVTRMLKHADSY